MLGMNHFSHLTYIFKGFGKEIMLMIIDNIMIVGGGVIAAVVY